MSGSKLNNELKLNQWKAKFLPKEARRASKEKDLRKILRSEGESEMRFSIQ
jgi:hypothetical protein